MCGGGVGNIASRPPTTSTADTPTALGRRSEYARPIERRSEVRGRIWTDSPGPSTIAASAKSRRSGVLVATPTSIPDDSPNIPARRISLPLLLCQDLLARVGAMAHRNLIRSDRSQSWPAPAPKLHGGGGPHYSAVSRSGCRANSHPKLAAYLRRHARRSRDEARFMQVYAPRRPIFGRRPCRRAYEGAYAIAQPPPIIRPKESPRRAACFSPR